MENLSFNMFDAIVIGLIILLSIKGLLSGFTKELFNAIGLIGGLFVATYYKTFVANYIHDNFLNSLSMPLLELLSLIVIFVAVYLVAKLIYKIIASVSSSDSISGASRLGGMIIKMVTLFFVFSLIAFGLSSKPQVIANFKDTLNSSKLYPLLRDSGSAILNAPTLTNSNSKAVQEQQNSSEKAEANNTKSTTIPVTEANTTKAETEAKPAATEEANNSSQKVNTTNKEANATQKEEQKEENNTTLNTKEESNNTEATISESNSTNENNATH
jgi:membrane protein required for colicin V production